MSRTSLALLAVLSSSSPGGSPALPEPLEEKALVQVRERGPVKVTLRVEPKEPSFADRVRFTIEAFAQKGVQVTLPAPGENLGELFIKDYDAPPERATADGTEYRRSYLLEFFTSGEYRIPPMTISFRPPGEPPPQGPPESSATEAQEFKIVTDEIVLQVKPLPDPASLDELAPIAPPAEPPWARASLAWPLGIGGGIAAAGLLVFAARKLLARERPLPPPVPPHERAYRDLEWLLSRAFIERGDLKEFFFHLSRILREYIESRFGVRAPELTTEEFLDEISRRGSGGIPREHRGLLREFLERADLVKFARYAPGREEIEASFEAAKRFIEATIPSRAWSREGGGQSAARIEEAPV